MDEITVKVSGTREILQAMKRLPDALSEDLLETGLRAGAALWRDAARLKVPVLEVAAPGRIRGLLRRSIRLSRGRADSGAFGAKCTVIVWIKPFTGRRLTAFKKRQRKQGKQGAPIPDPFYWRFVEFGTSKMKARSFMRTAFEENKFKAVDTAITNLRPLVQAEIEKLGSGY